MQAIQLVRHGKPGEFELRDLPEPKAGSGEVVVRVRACGVNHLDVWLEEGALPITVDLPRTPGCEIAGEIESVGAGVADWKPGDRVAIQSNLFCGECEFCVQGQESLCLRNVMLGVQVDGGFAQKVVVPIRALVRLPANVTFETSAALSLAGSTAMHMLTSRAAVKPGQWVLVMGAASGVGSAAIQIARGLDAKVITTASTPAKRELGLHLGAEAVLDTADAKWTAEVRRLTGRCGVDLIVEHVGGEVLQQCFSCLARGGTIVTCGATAGREVKMDLWPFFVKEQRLVGSYGRNRVDLEKTLQWASEGKLKPAIDAVVAIKDVPQALERLRSREVLGKIVVAPPQ